MPTTPVSFLAGLAAGTALGRAASGPAGFARMSGSSIARPDAAGWITDFLNAAYFRRPEAEREVDDLRLASAILTTAWHQQGGRRLRGTDVLAFHRAFGRARLQSGRSARGTLARDELLAGAARMLGPSFPDGYADPARRGWGIVFASVAARSAYRPEQRLALARLGPLTPGVAAGEQQTWHTYPPVAIPDVDAALAVVTTPERWPDVAAESGRFTPLRTGGLLGQTFEIEVAAGTSAGRPLFTRGYVTITKLVTGADQQALDDYIAALEDGLARFGQDEPQAIAEGGHALAAFDLTTHAGHFMGAGNNRLVLYADADGQAWVRAAGTWDPMPWYVQQAYERAGREAQHAFWGQTADPRQSMLHQLALATG